METEYVFLLRALQTVGIFVFGTAIGSVIGIHYGAGTIGVLVTVLAIWWECQDRKK
jgi:fatty acid-binding protein DegV